MQQNQKQCKNCDKPTRYKFCGHCGQQSNVEDIDFSYLWKQTLETGAHISWPLWNTYKGIVFDASRTIQEYRSGKRKVYQGPVPYLLASVFVFYVACKIFDQACIPIEEGSFRGLNILIFMIGAIVPISLAHFLVLRAKFSLAESYLCLMYLYGTAFFTMPAVLTLQVLVSTNDVVRGAIQNIPADMRFLLADGPFHLLCAFIALRFVSQEGLPLFRAIIVTLLSFGYTVGAHDAITALHLSNDHTIQCNIEVGRAAKTTTIN